MHLCWHSSSTLRSRHCVGIKEALQAIACRSTKVLLASHLLLLPAQLLLQLQLHL